MVTETHICSSGDVRLLRVWIHILALAPDFPFFCLSCHRKAHPCVETVANRFPAVFNTMRAQTEAQRMHHLVRQYCQEQVSCNPVS